MYYYQGTTSSTSQVKLFLASCSSPPRSCNIKAQSSGEDVDDRVCNNMHDVPWIGLPVRCNCTDDGFISIPKLHALCMSSDCWSSVLSQRVLQRRTINGSELRVRGYQSLFSRRATCQGFRDICTRQSQWQF